MPVGSESSPRRRPARDGPVYQPITTDPVDDGPTLGLALIIPVAMRGPPRSTAVAADVLGRGAGPTLGAAGYAVRAAAR